MEGHLKDLLDVISKYSRPLVTAVDLDPPDPSEVDSSDEEQFACDVSSPISETDPQKKDTFFQGDDDCQRSERPTEKEKQAPSRCLESSDLDSTKDTCSTGHVSRLQSFGPSERKKRASKNCSEPRNHDPSSSSVDGDRQSGSRAARKEQASNSCSEPSGLNEVSCWGNEKTSESDSSDEGELACDVSSVKSESDPQEKDVSLQEDDCLRSSCPTESEEQAFSSCFESSVLDSTKDTCSSGQENNCQSGSPAERKERTSDIRSEPSNQDSSSLSGDADIRQSGSPAERKKQASVNSSAASHKDSISSSVDADSRRPRSPTERKEHAPNNCSEPSNQDSSSLSGETDGRQTDSPAERKEQASHSCPKPTGLEKVSPCIKDETSTNGFIPLKSQRCNSSKEISSAERAGHCQSGSSSERKEQASNNHSKPSDLDSSSSSGETHGRQADSPAERKELASNSYSESSGLENVGRWSKDKKTSTTNGYKIGLVQFKEGLMTAMSLPRSEADLISWAQFNMHIFKNARLSYLNKLTFRNLMIAFRIPLSHVLHDMCLYSSTWCQFHAVLKKPALDSCTGALYSQNGHPMSSARFLKNVQPLDRKLEGIQKLLIKAAMPSFVICNFSESPGIQHKVQIPTLQEILLLCRESLIMCGQAFVAVTDLRQERVLDNLKLTVHSPSPSLFPNMKSSLLFGSDYMSALSRFMTEQKLTVSAPPFTPGEVDSNNLDVQVDEKTKRSIDKLVRFVVEMDLEIDAFNMDKMASNPNFWFLAAKESPAYRLYEKKLAEFQKSFVSSSDFTTWNNLNMNPPIVPTALNPKPQDVPLAPKESLAQPLQKRSGSAVPPQKDPKPQDVPLAPKESLAQPLQKRSGSTIRPQKDPKPQDFPLAPKESLAQPLQKRSGSAVPPQKDPKPQDVPLAPKESLAQPLQKSSGSAVPPQKDGFIDPLDPPPRKRKKLKLAVPAKSDVQDEFPEVDFRTRGIVERLAKFAVTLGPGDVKAQKEMLSNPDNWFLHKPDSQAYTFFKMKYIECVEAQKVPLSSSSKEQA